MAGGREEAIPLLEMVMLLFWLMTVFQKWGVDAMCPVFPVVTFSLASPS